MRAGWRWQRHSWYGGRHLDTKHRIIESYGDGITTAHTAAGYTGGPHIRGAGRVCRQSRGATRHYCRAAKNRASRTNTVDQGRAADNDPYSSADLGTDRNASALSDSRAVGNSRAVGDAPAAWGIERAHSPGTAIYVVMAKLRVCYNEVRMAPAPGRSLFEKG